MTPDESARLTREASDRLRASTARAREFLDARERHRLGRLTCVECGLIAEGRRATQGWVAYFDGDAVVVFCDECDGREFRDAN